MIRRERNRTYLCTIYIHCLYTYLQKLHRLAQQNRNNSKIVDAIRFHWLLQPKYTNKHKHNVQLVINQQKFISFSVWALKYMRSWATAPPTSPTGLSESSRPSYIIYYILYIIYYILYIIYYILYIIYYILYTLKVLKMKVWFFQIHIGIRTLGNVGKSFRAIHVSLEPGKRPWRLLITVPALLFKPRLQCKQRLVRSAIAQQCESDRQLAVNSAHWDIDNCF